VGKKNKGKVCQNPLQIPSRGLKQRLRRASERKLSLVGREPAGAWAEREVVQEEKDQGRRGKKKIGQRKKRTPGAIEHDATGATEKLTRTRADFLQMGTTEKNRGEETKALSSAGDLTHAAGIKNTTKSPDGAFKQREKSGRNWEEGKKKGEHGTRT